MGEAVIKSPSPSVQAFVLGGSAGAVEALGSILGSLPAAFRTPVVVVVHVPPRPRVALVQDPDEALLATMPAAALRRCPDAEVLGLAALGRRLCELGDVDFQGAA